MGLKHDLYLTRKPLAGFAAIGFAWSVYFAQMPVIKANVAASDGAYGMVGLIAAFGAIAAMWLAPLSQRIAGGLALPLGIIFLAVGMLGAGGAASLAALTLGLLIASAGSGVIDVLVNARVSEVEADSGRPLMNLNHALYSFAYAGGALATGAFREAELSPLPIFAVLCAVLALLAWAASGITPEIASADDDTPRMPYGVVYLGGAVVLVAFLAEASSEGWSALHLERTLGGTPGEGALGPALLGLTMGIGRLFGHALSRYVRDTTLMLLAVILSATGMTIAGLAPSVGIALAGFALAGLGISVVAPLALALIGRIVHPSARLAAISRASVVGYGAFFFGPPLMGFLAEGFGLRAAFVAVAGLLVVTAAVLIPMLARRAAF
jgi:MFS family permease